MFFKKKSVYKCNSTGIVFECLWDDKTGQSAPDGVEELSVNTVDASKEKHVPVIERDGNKVTVKIGSVAHPMTDAHYILFIEVVDGNYVYRRDLKGGDAAEAEFVVKNDKVTARAYCNLHGFWATVEG